MRAPIATALLATLLATLLAACASAPEVKTLPRAVAPKQAPVKVGIALGGGAAK